jgi:hypothetical protein
MGPIVAAWLSIARGFIVGRMSEERVMSAQTESWPRPHRLTVHDYYRMAEVGLLNPDDRTELIEGEIIDEVVRGALPLSTLGANIGIDGLF